MPGSAAAASRHAAGDRRQEQLQRGRFRRGEDLGIDPRLHQFLAADPASAKPEARRHPEQELATGPRAPGPWRRVITVLSRMKASSLAARPGRGSSAIRRQKTAAATISAAGTFRP